MVQAEYTKESDRVSSVKIKNVASFLEVENLKVDCPDLGSLTFDVAFGGKFYAIIDPQDNFPGLHEFKADELASWSREICKRINQKYNFVDPEDDRIHGLHHIMWTGDTLTSEATAR